ncbi:hypothetical protein F4553_000218 [Allocatelliglobosispora scoriae]|uniref:Uncharacterized protein n=1 Tax=Allocatelliglobosispora scoriae TaxID=643052 RepID=A0A841BI40_9ACTN|nr:hypothetical protein [Allocatelliglobosispora scoriae]MBB5866839.1 hypothetical protein [Allocatelliglobosispora scoriae]
MPDREHEGYLRVLGAVAQAACGCGWVGGTDYPRCPAAGELAEQEWLHLHALAVAVDRCPVMAFRVVEATVVGAARDG